MGPTNILHNLFIKKANDLMKRVQLTIKRVEFGFHYNSQTLIFEIIVEAFVISCKGPYQINYTFRVAIMLYVII